MLCGTSELQQLLVNREVFRSKMTPSALVRPPPLRCREKGEMVLQGQADMDSSHGTRSLTGRRFESGDRSDASGCGPLRLDRCVGARGPPTRGAGATAAAGRHDWGGAATLRQVNVVGIPPQVDAPKRRRAAIPQSLRRPATSRIPARHCGRAAGPPARKPGTEPSLAPDGCVAALHGARAGRYTIP